MDFGPVPLKDAEGAMLAHSLVLADGSRIRKGTILDAKMLRDVEAAGIETVTVARLADHDVAEDEAAGRIGDLISGNHLRKDSARTGRVNFFAAANGIFRVSRALVDAVNAIDPAITLATLHDFTEVNEGRIVATIKIIPYAVSSTSLARVLELDLATAFAIQPYETKSVAFIATELPGMKASVVNKTRANLEKRLALSGSSVVSDQRVPHETGAVANALCQTPDDCDLVVLFGASAISDERDVIPAAVEKAGGSITRFGMPVDPGNLLLLAELGGRPVVGAPGCARSPAENGFDWLLQRLCANIPVSADDVAGLGVGGLLMETGSRPHPRVARKPGGPVPVAAVILAAGQSRRMGKTNKMTVPVKGKPMVRHVGEAATGAGVDRVCVVTGYQPDETLAALSGLEIVNVPNPDHATGLSSSLAAGIAALPEKCGAAIILLGDMPFVTSAMIGQMLEASRDHPGHIIMATHEGKRGNPVLWPARFFDELQQVEGDVGARHIIGANADFVVEVELGRAASLDLDTPEALKAAGE